MFSKVYTPESMLEERVYSLLRNNCINHPEEIDLIELCRKYQCDVVLIDGRSRTFARPNRTVRYVFGVSKSLGNVVGRVRIAREFARIVLKDRIPPFDNEINVGAQRSLVDDITEHLLIPFYMFDKITFHKSQLNATQQIVQLFQVPEKMAKKRLEYFLNRVSIAQGELDSFNRGHSLGNYFVVQRFIKKRN